MFAHGADHIGYDHYVDLVSQYAVSHHIETDGGSLRLTTTPYRYVWPSELDLMARLAGLTLRHRWADFTGAPFTGDSRSHVSVWQKPG